MLSIRVAKMGIVSDLLPMTSDPAATSTLKERHLADDSVMVCTNLNVSKARIFTMGQGRSQMVQRRQWTAVISKSKCVDLKLRNDEPITRRPRCMTRFDIRRARDKKFTVEPPESGVMGRYANERVL